MPIIIVEYNKKFYRKLLDSFYKKTKIYNKILITYKNLNLYKIKSVTCFQKEDRLEVWQAVIIKENLLISINKITHKKGLTIHTMIIKSKERI